MNELLSRENFKKECFKRDKGICVLIILLYERTYYRQKTF
jgi:hypothetical protein